jgi:hypothetical protein
MMHFWGIHPTSPTTLGNSITALGLKKPVEIYDRIQQYKQLIPVDNAAYQTWCTNWWGFQPSSGGFGVEREHAQQWSTYDGTDAAAIHARRSVADRPVTAAVPTEPPRCRPRNVRNRATSRP